MVEKARPTHGVLIDYDIATHFTQRQAPLQPAPNQVGTLPFISTELLSPRPPPQRYYRHDLESFFFVLAWILIRYQNGRTVPGIRELEDWCFGSRRQIRMHKMGFYDGVLDYTPAQFGSLMKRWLDPLGRMFGVAYRSIIPDDYNFYGPDPEDRYYPAMSNEQVDTLAGHVTFAKFWSILQS